MTHFVASTVNNELTYRGNIAMVTKRLKAGDKVSWDSAQGKIKGTVKKKLTSKTHIKTHKVDASKEEPEYLVESDKTGAKAAHKPSALKKLK